MKIEVSKFYSNSSENKVIVLEWAHTRSNGENLYKCYDYQNENVLDVSECDLKPWVDEPKVGWFYDSDREKYKYKVIYDVSKYGYEGRFRFVMVNLSNGNIEHCNAEGWMLYNGRQLKLETGRPADE